MTVNLSIQSKKKHIPNRARTRILISTSISLVYLYINFLSSNNLSVKVVHVRSNKPILHPKRHEMNLLFYRRPFSFGLVQCVLLLEMPDW